MIKNIVFDMGNVLLSYDPEVCLRHFLDSEEDRKIIRRELFEGPQWVEGDLGYIKDSERFAEVSKRVPERLHEALMKCVLEWDMCMLPVSGAREFCDEMRKEGYKLYVLSNASDKFYDYFPRFAPFDYFDGIVVSCDIHVIKPEKGIYQYLLNKYGLLPEECFFIDDREENVEGAKQIGMNGAVFTGDFQKIKKLLKPIFAETRTLLKEAADEKYRDFNSSLIPGKNPPMLGVRMPKVREIAKKVAKEHGREYICAVREEEAKGQVCHEELLLHGIVIGYLKCDDRERKELLDGFVPVINNWAVCDCSCMTYKFMKKSQEEWFDYLLKYIESPHEYEVRFAVVAMLDHFVTEQFIDRVLEHMNGIHHEGYYVKMAVAWAVSVCFVKFPEKTKRFLQDNRMDDFTQNKSIQKIRESFRVSKEDKEEILTWKR